jgi:hypothetical protein
LENYKILGALRVLGGESLKADRGSARDRVLPAEVESHELLK